jgi:hypothetical protein
MAVPSSIFRSNRHITIPRLLGDEEETGAGAG